MEQFSLLFCMLKKKKIHLAYVSKNNSNSEKKVILLVILSGEKHEAKSEGWRLWHYFAVKKLSTLLTEITSKHYGDFYYWIVFILSQQKKWNRIKEYVIINIYINLSCLLKTLKY